MDCKISKPEDIKFFNNEFNIWIEGTATKQHNRKWLVILTNDNKWAINENNLLNKETFLVNAVSSTISQVDIDQDAHKLKRQQKREEAKNESKAKKIPTKKLNEMKRDEYKKICELI